MAKQKCGSIQIYLKKKAGTFGENETFLQEALFSYSAEKGIAQEIALGDFRIERTPEGKPYVSEDLGIYFSVSHTKDWWLCAVAGEPIGADIEERGRRVSPVLADRFCHEEERNVLERYADESIRCRTFLEIWTRKEAYVKYVGKGIPYGMASFSVIGDERLRELYFSEEIPLIGAICTEHPTVLEWRYS